MYLKFEKYDFERVLSNAIAEKIGGPLPAYVFDSAIVWLMDIYHSIDADDYGAIASALWNGYVRTETAIPSDVQEFLTLNM